MGDYSEFCSVSGLPFNYGDECVIIPVEKYRFYKANDREFSPKWVPRGWPSFGTYDNAGGFDGQPKHPFIIIHKSVWDNANIYWHYMNRKEWNVNFTQIKEDAEKDKRRNDELIATQGKDNFWMQYAKHKMTDYVFDCLKNKLDRSCKGLTLRKLFYGKNVSKAGSKDSFCFLNRNRFAETVCEKIVGGMSEEDMAVLDKIVCIFGSAKVIGHCIVPSCISIFPEQCPDDFTQRIAILKQHLSIAQKLNRKKKK